MCSVFWILQDFENREGYLFETVGSGVREQVSGSGSDSLEPIAYLLLCPQFLSFKIAMYVSSLNLSSEFQILVYKCLLDISR